MVMAGQDVRAPSKGRNSPLAPPSCLPCWNVGKSRPSFRFSKATENLNLPQGEISQFTRCHTSQRFKRHEEEQNTKASVANIANPTSQTASSWPVQRGR